MFIPDHSANMSDYLQLMKEVINKLNNPNVSIWDSAVLVFLTFTLDNACFGFSNHTYCLVNCMLLCYVMFIKSRAQLMLMLIVTIILDSLIT